MKSNESGTVPQLRLTGYFTHDAVDVPNPLDGAPECPERLAAVENNLIAIGLDDRVIRQVSGPASLEAVLRVHDKNYVGALRAACEGDREAAARFEAPDMRTGPGIYDAALKSVGAVTDAVDAVMTHRVRNAFCAVRPPGHHASRDTARGFCYFNNVCAGVMHAIEKFGLTRVAIVDFDAHHGDGTEEIVAGDSRIRFFSLFQKDLWPNRFVEPTPANVTLSPMPPGADSEMLNRVIEQVWLPQLDAFAPQLIFLSAGFDAHAEERMAQLKFREADYARLTRRLLDVAEQHAEGRLISVLEGGYAPRSLARSVMAHLSVLATYGLRDNSPQ